MSVGKQFCDLFHQEYKYWAGGQNNTDLSMNNIIIVSTSAIFR